MLNIIQQKNANQNHNEVSPYTSQDVHHQKIYKQKILEDVEKRQYSCTTGGNVNWYNNYGEQYEGSLRD